MSNPANLYITQYCPTCPNYVTALSEFVAAFRRWLSELAPKLVREWTAARIAAELAKLRLNIDYEDGRTVIYGIKPH